MQHIIILHIWCHRIMFLKHSYQCVKILSAHCSEAALLFVQRSQKNNTMRINIENKYTTSAKFTVLRIYLSIATNTHIGNM